MAEQVIGHFEIIDVKGRNREGCGAVINEVVEVLFLVDVCGFVVRTGQAIDEGFAVKLINIGFHTDTRSFKVLGKLAYLVLCFGAYLNVKVTLSQGTCRLVERNDGIDYVVCKHNGDDQYRQRNNQNKEQNSVNHDVLLLVNLDNRGIHAQHHAVFERAEGDKEICVVIRVGEKLLADRIVYVIRAGLICHSVLLKELFFDSRSFIGF